MATTSSPDDEYVLICGVPWDSYERILDAVGEFHLRHTYDRGTLEMRRVLHGVPPKAYRKLLDALPEHHLRHTYDGWTLEMMTPRKDHEWPSELIGGMLRALALALDIPVQSVGSTTLSAAKGGRGLQPDKAYYFGKELQVRFGEVYRPGKDPPPDLVIEVDVTNTSVPRLPIFARIGVPEIWRYVRDEVRFYRLTRQGKYLSIRHSVALPFLTPDDVTRCVNMRNEKDENSVIRAFVRLAKKRREERQGKLRQAGPKKRSPSRRE